MISNSLVALICLAGLITALPAMAKDKPPKSPKGAPGRSWESSNRDRRAEPRESSRPDRHGAFSDEERRVILGYAEQYQAMPGRHERPLPPGLAKKVARGGKLPPGWQKRFVPGQVVPVEVYEECRPLPRELVVKLPPPPDLTVTVAIDGRVLRLLRATREILDVFDVHVRF